MQGNAELVAWKNTLRALALDAEVAEQEAERLRKENEVLKKELEEMRRELESRNGA